ncbi:MAG TPA: hypothetical protein PKD64_06740 [Pirellulaceae bacterium]|nr:hypothetical protein [Pirellulaceae bacterium]HMO91880.1 hypothetical protein [Pirellulaceae bacterium]HMP69710.1 hypothetical protein [Pirellulaceae bacterium]
MINLNTTPPFEVPKHARQLFNSLHSKRGSRQPDARNGFGDMTIEEAAACEIIHQITERSTICGSVSITNPDLNSLLKIGLIVAASVQRRFGLTVGWLSSHANRLRHVAHLNHFEGYNVEIASVMINHENLQFNTVDLLVIDGVEDYATPELQRFDEQFEPQIVVGLAGQSPRPSVLDLFDHNLAVDWNWNDPTHLYGSLT